MHYLKKYSSIYHTRRIPQDLIATDQETIIILKYKSPSGIEPYFYHIWHFKDDLLIATMPVRAAKIILKEYRRHFSIHRDSEDCIDLLFNESLLEEFADLLNVRKRKRISLEHYIKFQKGRKQLLISETHATGIEKAP